MDEFWLLLIIPLFLLVGAALGVHAWFVTRALRADIQQLQQRLDQLSGSATPDQTRPATPLPVTQDSAVADAPSEQDADTAWGITGHRPVRPEKNEHPIRPGRLTGWVQQIRQHWMIWLGGLCVGLAGVFMVRYSIEQGLLGPEARVILSLIAGAALHAAAEWLRRQQGQNNVFAALAGGASIILYAALFAAFKLLPMISTGLIFAVMAGVSFATLALALRQGPILAALGMLGGYLVPILVNTGSGDIELALVYAAILSLFSLWLLGYVQRQWLWLGVIGGSLLWWALSLGANPAPGVRSTYLLALAYLFLAVPRHDWLLRRQEDHESGWCALLKQTRSDRHWPVIPMLLLLTLAQGYTLTLETLPLTSYPSLLLMPALLLLAASRRPVLNPVPVLMLVTMALATLMPMITYLQGQWVFTPPSADVQTALASRFVMLTLLYTAAAGWLARRTRYPGFWTGLGCFTPLLMLALGYYLFTAFSADWAWGASALVLGFVYLALARMSLEYNLSDRVKVILLTSAHLGLSLAAVIWFDSATLTLAFAAQLITLSLLQERYRLAYLPWIIRGVLALVVCRLTFNPWVLSYDSSTHWSLWTGGGATVCAFASAWILRRDTRMTAWLQGAGAHLLVLTLAAEVRYWLYNGDILRAEYGFLEASLNTLIWGTAGLVYLWRARLSRVLTHFYQIIATLHLLAAGASYTLVVLVSKNPLWSSTGISSTPVWNELLLSYGAPTLLLLFLWRVLPRALARWIGLAAGLNLLLFVSLEIRHLWQDGLVHLSHRTPDGELYTYSAVWLALASCALIAGSWRQQRGLYQGGMALLLVVVAKLFLVDMAGLTGLWRVASFMGLGLALLALAWLHQRLTPPAQNREPVSAPEPGQPDP